ncbi:hypothetical protein [Chryseosolibacter indicus]|uniref:Uncharacterized protein n=1 Tax=Chryseosolibacter indicus TaxID=2782351 RepID=A0ABS5VZ59_9BACT|nr:hypothetical protein [Chryseosolibacter indicus]MBT1706199.1 hypothetical protein [Chryseosolibacter indicus]
MTSFKSFILLTFISIQAIGQGLDSLTKDNWIEKQLGIVDMPSSDNEVNLRIFLDRGITNGGHVLRIVKSSDGWTGTKYDYLLKMKKGQVTEKIAKTTRTELKSNNWDSLWAKLEALNIMTLPSQDDIKDKLRKEVTTKRGKGYEVMVVTDGSGYNLKLKRLDKIVQFSFHEPWTYSQKYPDVEEVRKYSDIISTLEKEFQIKFRQ